MTIETSTERVYTVDDIKQMLETIHLQNYAIDMAAQKRREMTQAVYDARMTQEDWDQIEAIKKVTNDTAIGQQKFELETIVIEWVKRTTHSVESEHMKAVLVKGRKSGASIGEIETFSKMLPLPYSTQALTLIKQGQLSAKIEAKPDVK